MIPVNQIRGFADENTEIKKHHSIAEPILVGAGLHAGANVANKIFRNTHAGHNFEAQQTASGFRHGVAGQNINPIARNVATFGVGPESMINYDLGRTLGTQMAPLSNAKRYKSLKKLRKNMAMSEHVQHAPMGRNVVPAVNRILADQKGLMDRIPGAIQAGAAPTTAQRIISGGLGTTAAVLAPHSAIHMGINAARNAVGKSDQGKKFMKDQLVAGIRKGPVSPMASNAFDVAVSPAALDTRRLGTAMAREQASNPQLAARLGASLGGQAYDTMPGIRSAVTSKIRQAAPTANPEQLIAQLRAKWGRVGVSAGNVAKRVGQVI